MAEEIPDDRFKSEMIRMMETVILKLGEHGNEFINLKSRFDTLEEKFDVLSAQMTEIGLESHRD